MRPELAEAPPMDTTEFIPCEDIKDKRKADDIGEKTEWCSNGRVYKCLERVKDGKRAKCSAGITKESIDLGTWVPMRA